MSHERHKRLAPRSTKIRVCLAYQARIELTTTDDGREGLCATCLWCKRKEVVAGRGDQSRRRAILLLEEEC